MAEDEIEEAAPPRPPFPWVCALVIGVSCVAYAMKMYHLARWPPKSAPDWQWIELRFGALFAPAVRGGQWWRMVSYAFAHGSLMHIAFNMMVAASLGIPLERRVGTARFAQMSLVGCVGAAGLTLAFSRTPVMLVGASGMIFGWAGALLPLVTRAQLRELGRWLLFNALLSLLPGISLLGHLGGFLFGLPCGLLLRTQPQRFSMLTPFLVAAAAGLGLYGAYR